MLRKGFLILPFCVIWIGFVFDVNTEKRTNLGEINVTEQFDCIFLSFAVNFCWKTTQYNIEDNPGPVVDECDRINFASKQVTSVRS